MLPRVVAAAVVLRAWTSPPPLRRPRRRSRVRLAGAAVPIVLAAALATAARAQLPAAHPAAGVIPGELIVKFRPDVSAAGRADALAGRDARPERSLHLRSTVLARVPAGADTAAAIRALERDPRVAWAEPNALRVGGALPNDPYLDEQWALRNTGQTVDGVAGAAGADINAPAAWERTTGSPDVKVAVVDSGINFDQPDLAPNIWRNPGESGAGREHNGIDDDGNGFVDDWRGWDFVQDDNDPSDNFGHGTHVAGTIAARGDNGLGIAGVAWRASLIPIRVLDNTNAGSCAEVAAGMAYAVRMGARIVNLSLGTHVACQAEEDVVDRAPDTLFVVAAMNDGADVDQQPEYPCAIPSPNVICVAATDSGDRLADFSNYGAHSVDLAAPGVSILSSFVKWGPTETLFTDGFETPLDGRWVTGGSPDSWTRTPFAPIRTGGYSLSNSLLGNYGNNTDNWARLTQGLDLSDRRDCAAILWARTSLGPLDPGQPIDAQDRLVAETSSDGGDWGRRMNALLGTSTGFDKWVVDLSLLEGRSTGGLRFHLVSNGSGTFGGVALDDLRIICVPPLTTYTGAPDEFAFDWGTSMATPHVSGVAALVLSLEPGLSGAQLRQRLMSTADPVPGLEGRTVTGGRLDAARAVAPPPAGPAVRQGPAAGPPPAAPAPRDPRAAIGSLLDAQLAAVGRALGSIPTGALLRRGGLDGVRLFAPAPGRLALTITGGGRTIAVGACSVRRAARCAPQVRLTRGGRALLRAARRLRVAVVLTFAPRGGAPFTRRSTVTLRRHPH